MPAADVKLEIPVLVQSLKASILSLTSFQMGKRFREMMSAAVEQSTWLFRETDNLVLFGPNFFKKLCP